MPRWCLFCSNRTGALLVAGAQLVIAMCGVVMAIVVVTSSMSTQIANLEFKYNDTTDKQSDDRPKNSTFVVNGTNSGIIQSNISSTAVVTISKTISKESQGAETKEWMGIFARQVEASSKASLYSLGALDIISPVCLIIGIHKNMILLVIVWMVVNICETLGAALLACFLIVLVSLDWRWVRTELERQNVTITADVGQNLDNVVNLIFTIGVILLIAASIYICMKIYFLVIVWSARLEVYRQLQIVSGSVVRPDEYHHHHRPSGDFGRKVVPVGATAATGRSSITTIQMAPVDLGGDDNLDKQRL